MYKFSVRIVILTQIFGEKTKCISIVVARSEKTRNHVIPTGFKASCPTLKPFNCLEIQHVPVVACMLRIA